MFWILLLALFLRLINLNQPLWLDEAFQFKSTYYFSVKDLLTVYLPGDFNPPLSYLINFGFSRLFGFSEIALRLPAVIFGVLTVWLVYKLGGKWPALLLATSGLHIYYSQEARMYSLAALAVTASFYFLRQKRWFWYSVFSLMSIYSHYLTVFVFPAQIIISKKQDLKKLLLSWVGIVVGFLPWLPVFVKQLAAGQQTAGTNWGEIVGGLSLKNLSLIPVKFLIGRISIANNQLYALLVIPPFILTAYLLFRALRRKNLLLAVWLFVPAVLIILLSCKLPVLSYFRLLFLLPAFYLLVARSKQKKLLCLLVGFNLACSLIYLFNPAFHREDWRGLSQQIIAGPVVINPAVNAPLKYYYAGEILGTDSLPEENFYYITYAEPIFDPEQKFKQQAAETGFQETSVQHFRGNLTLIEYNQ